MLHLDRSELAEEAEKCRSQALAYLGTREASFLLHIASEFDRLADEKQPGLGESSQAAETRGKRSNLSLE